MVKSNLFALYIHSSTDALVEGYEGLHRRVLEIGDCTVNRDAVQRPSPDASGRMATEQGQVALVHTFRRGPVWSTLWKPAQDCDLSPLSYSHFPYVMDGVGDHHAGLIVQHPHYSTGVHIPGIARRFESTMTFTVAQQ